MKLAIEIRAAEGGDDAKLLVAEQEGIYNAYAKVHGLAVTTLDAGKG